MKTVDLVRICDAISALSSSLDNASIEDVINALSWCNLIGSDDKVEIIKFMQDEYWWK